MSQTSRNVSTNGSTTIGSTIGSNIESTVRSTIIWSTNGSLPDASFWTKTERSWLAITMLVIMTTAIVGNTLVIAVVLRNRGMRTRTNLFLCNLAVADLLCALLDMPFSLLTILNGTWMFDPAGPLCQINGFLLPFFLVASIHTLMYTAIHKYLSIRNPFSTVLSETRVPVTIAAAWIWAGMTSVMTVTGLTRVEYKNYTAQCGPVIPHDTRSYVHMVFVQVTCYAVPLLIIACCYCGLFRHIRELGDRLEARTTTDRLAIGAQQRRILYTLVLVLVTFIVSWTPWIIYSIYITVNGDDQQLQQDRLVNPITYWFGYLSSACNPIIYAFRSKAFRQGYAEALCSIRWRRRYDDSSESKVTQIGSDGRKISTRQLPWQLQFPLPSRLQSRTSVAKQRFGVNSDKRLSTYSLPEKTNYAVTSSCADVTASNRFISDLTIEPEVTTNGSDRQPETRDLSIETIGESRSRKSQDSNPNPGIFIFPKYRTIDWRVIEGRSGSKVKGSTLSRGGHRGQRSEVESESVSRGRIFDLSATERLILNVHAPLFQIQAYPEPMNGHGSVTLDQGPIQTLPQTDPSSSSSLSGFRKRISQKWKRQSHKNHPLPLPPQGHPGHAPLNPVRRSETHRPLLQRCPSVEHLDHHPHHRDRIKTGIPDGFRRQKTRRPKPQQVFEEEQCPPHTQRDNDDLEHLGQTMPEVIPARPQTVDSDLVSLDPIRGVKNNRANVIGQISPRDRTRANIGGMQRVASAPCLCDG